MREPREVVITGVGVVSPIGIGNDAFWASLDAGVSGIGRFEDFAGTPLPYRFAGEVHGFDGKDYVQPRKTLKVMSREIQQAYAAAQMAMQQAGLAKGSIDPERLGVVLGSQLLDADMDEVLEVYSHGKEHGGVGLHNWGEYAFKDLYPLWMLKYLPNMAACHIGIAHDARGPNNTIVQGGASSLLAFMEATMAVTRGNADVMLTGGSGSLITLSRLPFRGWEHLSQWDGDPAQAIRPFDANRSGSVLGEGAGVIALESREHAERRGANILARVLGFSSRFEPKPATGGRTGSGVQHSIAGALQSASLAATDIGHINANGLGTIADDAMEAAGIRAAAGDAPVFAPKSYFGDLGGGSGAVELIASVLSVVQGKTPRTLNYETPDPVCPVNVVHGESAPLDQRTAIVLSQSDTGQAAAVMLGEA